ncbi:MAG: LytR C-terminal domain-containing protein [Candidatus Levybacteria bacterium]|nr:LytR C-terminal domain-containing protein [Candidatus Levybacteria bacterium]
MKKKKDLSGKNTKFAIIFFAFIALIVFASLVYKTILLIGRSRFDSDNKFNVLVWDNKNIKVLSFSPDKGSISVLRIEGDRGEIDIYKFLEIPLDAHISTDSKNFNNDIKQLLSSAVLNSRDTKSDLNTADIVKLWIFLITVKEESIKEENLSINLDEAERDKILSEVFEEEKIAQEKINIEVVNSAGEYGLGNRIARLLTNIGGNVILVSTSQNLEEKSAIFYKGEQVYTLERLKKILRFNTQENKQTIGDITIRVGKDYNKFIKY